jgi:hypothetical protein
MTDPDKAAALEKKRRRLEAWKKRQEDKAKAAESAEPKSKISLSLGVNKLPKKKKKKKVKKRPFGFENFDDEKDIEKEEKKSLELIDLESMKASNKSGEADVDNKPSSSSPAKKKRRWDAPTDVNPTPEVESKATEDSSRQQLDDLDKFMENLNSGAIGEVVQNALSVDVSGSMMRKRSISNASKAATPISGGIITPQELAKLTHPKSKQKSSSSRPEGALYGPSDWETSASEVSSSCGSVDSFYI